MKAVYIQQFGDSSELELGEVSTPEPSPDEVQIRIDHTSVNPVDWKIRDVTKHKMADRRQPAGTRHRRSVCGCGMRSYAHLSKHQEALFEFTIPTRHKTARIIFYGKDARLVVSMSSLPSDPLYETMELVEQLPDGSCKFRQLDMSTDRPPFQRRCSLCGWSRATPPDSPAP